MTHVIDALGRIKEYWGSVALADLDDYAQGRIIRGGAVAWEAYDASTLGAVLIGDGADVISTTAPTIAGLVTGQAGFIATGYTIAGAPAAADYMVFGMDSPTGRIFAYDPVAAAYLALISDVDIYRLRYGSTDTNVLHYLLRLEVFTSNVAAAGLGTGIEFQIEDDGGGVDVLGTIECISTDVTAGAEHGAVIVRTADIGDDGLVERWRWDHDGAIAVAGPNMIVPNGWILGIGTALERIIFDAAGDISVMGADFVIGGTVASARLDVMGSATAGTRSLLLRSGDISAPPADSHQIIFGFSGTNDYLHSIRTRHEAASDVGNAIDFYVWDWGTDAVDNTPGTNLVMTLNGGNVGITTPTPLEKLSIDSGKLVVHTTGAHAAAAGAEAIEVQGGGAGISFLDRGAATNRFVVFNNAGLLRFWETGDRLIIAQTTGHVYPGGNKTQDLGLAPNRWREIFCSLALNTGTSRLVSVQKNCAVDGTQLVRSTGGLRVLGEESDFLLAFCPACGTVAMEELRHRTSSVTKPAPKVVLTGMEVLKHSGNTKSVTVSFRYGDDMEGEMGIQKAPHNSTTLSDDELAAFLGMADDKERCAFLLELGRIEWNALEKMEVVGPELDDEQTQIDFAIQDLIGIDLLKGVASGKPN